MIATAPGYNWVSADTNGVNEQNNLEMLTANMLGYIQAGDPRIVMVGDSADLGSLPAPDRKAYSWALNTFGLEAGYMSFADVVTSGLPTTAKVVWYHNEDDPVISSDAMSAASTIGNFVDDGGGLFLTSFATEYAVTVGATTVSTSETINNNPAGPDAAWGIRPFPGFENHPLFANIPPTTDWADPNWMGFRTVSDSIAGHEAIRWWTQNTFPGTGMAAMPWFGGLDLPVVGEIGYGKGNVLITSAPGYQWLPADSNGVNEQTNLEQYTQNALDYLAPKPSLILVGGASSIADMADGEQNAYDWALSAFSLSASYMSFSDVAANGLPESAQVFWYHQEDSVNYPAGALMAADTLGAFIENGGGALLSGFATEYVADMEIVGVNDTTNETIDNDPAGPDAAWGVRPFPAFASHPIFANIPPTTDWADPNWSGFRTISDSVAGREAIRWWTQNTYPGTGLAAMPWFGGEDLPVTGEIISGSGGALTMSAPGYSWISADINGANEQANLELYTQNMLNYLYTIDEQQQFSVSYAGGDEIDEGDEDGKVLDVNVANAIFKDPLTQADWVIDNLPPGVSANLVRIDDQNATLTLSGTASDYDVDITDFTVKVPSSEFLNLKGDTAVSVGEVIFKAFVEIDVNPGKIAVLGVEPTLALTEPNARSGYQWAKDTFGDTSVTYFSFMDVVIDSVNFLSNYAAAWFHYEEFENLPLVADNENVSRIMRKFREESGGGILLSGTATQYAVNLNFEPNTLGMQVALLPETMNPDHWGFRVKPDALTHPAFANLGGLFTTLFTNGTRENPISWWVINPNDPNYASIPVADRFHGRHLAGPEWDSNFDIVVSLAEYEGNPGEGNVIAVGAGAWDWYIPDGVNEDSTELQTLAFNILNYLKATSATGINDLENHILAVTAFPNPFKEEVNIRFTLDKMMDVSVEILDIQGRVVDVLESRSNMLPGTHVTTWRADQFSNGMYFYRIKADQGVVNGKILLQR